MGTPSEIPPATLLAGKIRLIQRIGRGGMGDVWIARNEATQAEVAVKTLQRTERTPLHDERFRREARLAATVSHRNVVRIFDLVDEDDGTLGLVMELLRGGTLEECMRQRGPLSTTQAVAVACAILSALNHVHDKGIVHRDVKPSNVFFAVEPDGHVIPKILDFGIAKLPAASSALTVDGSVLGTPHYMAPEQIRGVTDIDGRSDMFSLASVLYEMLTGVRPFQRDSAAASLAAVLEHEVDPDPRIEPRLWVAIARALAKRPYERFATCAELADALRAAIDAGEEDLSSALQELRPRSEAIPESDRTSGGGLASSSPSPRSTRSRGGARVPRSVTWALGAAAVAAVLAVTGTLAVTRSASTGVPPEETLPEASTPLGSAAPAGAARDVPVPPAAPPPPALIASGPMIATPLAAPAKAPGPAPLNRGRPPPPPPRPPVVSATKPLPPPTTTRPVATSPGF
ncbi:MAG TPA: serine/threonine-protein kinase [Labilithrix sp.]|nr:serine/threonine-protein kinase [Labilithrix sp.]